MKACIVIAKLIGILSTEPNTPVNLYKLDCYDSEKFIIIKGELIEVDIVKINPDLTYIVKEK